MKKILLTVIPILFLLFISTTPVLASAESSEQSTAIESTVESTTEPTYESNIPFYVLGSFMALTMITVVVWVFITDDYVNKKSYNQSLEFLEMIKNDDDLRERIDAKLKEISLSVSPTVSFDQQVFENECQKQQKN